MIKNNFSSLPFIFISLFFFAIKSNAQTGTLSPYSRYGIGELQFNGFAYQRAMGGLGAALQSTGRLNFLNPASYAADTLATAEIGVEGMLVKLTDGINSQKKQNGNLTSLSLGFPLVKNRWGLSFGITPYSAVGYNIKERKQAPDADYIYSASGGINRFYIGNGFRLTKNLYAGFNASYLFGSINRTRKIEFFESGFLNNRYTQTITVSDILLDYGLQYKFNLKKDYILMAGISGSNSSKINATKSILWENYTIRGTNVSTLRDTVENSKQSGAIVFPFNFTAGFYLTKNTKWGLGLDVNYQDWSNYKAFDETEDFDKSFKIAMGGQWIPDNKSIKYLNRIEYRLGGFYRKGYLQVKNTDINETGLTAGFGFPLRKSFQSMVNVSFEFGERGTIKNNLVRERYGKLLIGITFNEDWFHRQKYD